MPFLPSKVDTGYSSHCVLLNLSMIYVQVPLFHFAVHFLSLIMLSDQLGVHQIGLFQNRHEIQNGAVLSLASSPVSCKYVCRSMHLMETAQLPTLLEVHTETGFWSCHCRFQHFQKLAPKTKQKFGGVGRESYVGCTSWSKFYKLDMVIFLAYAWYITLLAGEVSRCWHQQTLMIPAKK